MNDLQGWLNIYKPKNISSFSVIRKIKKKFNIQKIGHAGTLDPLAEGILPIAIGKTTKLISFINDQEKEYEFDIKWGEQTSTDDSEGEVIARSLKVPNNQQIVEQMNKLKGSNPQIPPKASAVKINGQRAYNLFRSKIDFKLNSKIVALYEFNILFTKEQITKLQIKCGKGFYVRSLARDLGEKLGTKCHISSLKRLKVGKFNKKNSILLDDLLKIGQMHFGFREIHPSISMLDDILAYEIDDEHLINEIAHGKSVEIDKKIFFQKSLNLNESRTIFLTFKNKVLSYGKFDGNLYKPQKVLI